MFKIDFMRLVGLDEENGLLLSWKFDGFLIEIFKNKVNCSGYVDDI